MAVDTPPSGLLYWHQIRAHLDDLHKRYRNMRGKEDREVWMNLGKLELIEELENLPDTLAFIEKEEKDHQARQEREKEAGHAKGNRVRK